MNQQHAAQSKVGGQSPHSAHPPGHLPRLKVFQKVAGVQSAPNRIFGLFSRSPRVGEIMARHGGAGPGFDAMRVALSLTILVYHAKQVALGRATANYAESAIFPFLLALVPIFFCLSGFLVTGSALRTRSVRLFLTNRSLRIFPALTVEVFLSALILGPILTSASLADYFSSRQFFSYFGNIIGRVRMSLPGVFLDNPIPDTVNASLWTLQPEFYSYVLMTGLMASTVVFRRGLATVLYVALTVGLSLLNWHSGFGRPSDVFPGHVVVYFFATGVIAFHWSRHIPVNLFLFVLAAALSYFMITTPGLMFVASIPIAYCTIYVGMLRLPLVAPFNKGDYSYGIYLFNFPIQQTVVHFFPGVSHWWLPLLISVPLTVLFAAVSWHWIEKPTLKLKRRFAGGIASPSALAVSGNKKQEAQRTAPNTAGEVANAK
jgi:peptidoglycan/LPS O-acetylase OafA/YrhL